MNEQQRLFNITVSQTTEDLYQNSGSVIRMQGLKQDTVDKLIPIFTKCGMTVVIEPVSV